ncbi:hypothetical protein, partial [Streptococcus pneumoniae]|uniref:hypothetical protein n=1 Tax=Streptococcus pneumoniae TaxID=1313 RepID=UPI001E651360
SCFIEITAMSISPFCFFPLLDFSLQNDPKATASQFIKNEYYRLHDKLHYNIVEPFFQVIVLVFPS